MSPFDIYVFVLCLIVFLALTGLFSVMIFSILKLTIRSVRAGLEDERIIAEYRVMQKRKMRVKRRAFERVISVSILCILFLCFAFSLYVNLAGAPTSDTVPSLSVVQSNSMGYKNKKNFYLVDNKLDDQFQTFDLVLLYKLPAVEDLKLYDIVCYEVDGTQVIHRIVDIQPPTATRDEYYFLMQGDALENPDRFPVYYSQMRGIYRGEHIPFIGSFVSFMQSMAGYLCILLLALGIILVPLLEKRLNSVKKKRLVEIGMLYDTSDYGREYRRRRTR